MTFNSVDEINKIQKLHLECYLQIRIKAPDEDGCMYPMGSKFSSLPEEVSPLFQVAQNEGIKVFEVSFHIGRKSYNSQAYKTAIEATKAVFQEAVKLGMTPMNILNIGGGFVSDTLCFEAATSIVNTVMDECFPEDEERRGSCSTFMTEPGRYFAETTFTVVTNIIGKRVRHEVREYWTNKGFFGSMMFVDSAILADSCNPLKWMSAKNSNENSVHFNGA